MMRAHLARSGNSQGGLLCWEVQRGKGKEPYILSSLVSVVPRAIQFSDWKQVSAD